MVIVLPQFLYAYIIYLFLDVIDIVKEPLHRANYVREEDLKYDVSEKIRRGPLSKNWISEYWKELQVIN